ncbi:hypothetical protein GSI01S_02_00250 [Gordonia sihwensis NBRC 108236]|uniref:Uncharacterized protein n=1 Tax=Gordonia sihwensis NBRC 108236 TaxID=1223544 RepID=L7LF71_9ACTN|nr:hypothetical protein GSI01S_02_00250 [Gordonia sihwensis NBRC 108236]
MCRFPPARWLSERSESKPNASRFRLAALAQPAAGGLRSLNQRRGLRSLNQRRGLRSLNQRRGLRSLNQRRGLRSLNQRRGRRSLNQPGRG